MGWSARPGGLRARDRHHLHDPAEGRVTRTAVPAWRPSGAPPTVRHERPLEPSGPGGFSLPGSAGTCRPTSSPPAGGRPSRTSSTSPA